MDDLPDTDTTPVPDAAAEEAPPRAVDPLRVWGLGPMPAALDRFNWAALLMPFVWLVFAGVWDWLVIWASVRGAAFIYEVLVVLPAAEADKLVPWMELVRLALYVPLDVLLIMLGMRANRLSWEAEERASVRASTLGVERRRRTVGEKLRNDRILAYIGGGLTLSLVVLSFYELATQPALNTPVTYAGVGLDGAMFGVAFALWLKGRRGA